MTDFTDDYCLWQCVDNAYCVTECCDLIQDKGRQIAVLNEYRKEAGEPLLQPRPFIKRCPKCKKLTMSWEDIRRLEAKFKALPDPYR